MNSVSITSPKLVPSAKYNIGGAFSFRLDAPYAFGNEYKVNSILSVTIDRYPTHVYYL